MAHRKSGCRLQANEDKPLRVKNKHFGPWEKWVVRTQADVASQQQLVNCQWQTVNLTVGCWLAQQHATIAIDVQRKLLRTHSHSCLYTHAAVNRLQYCELTCNLN